MRARQETSVAIEAPAERVWDVLTDVERWPEWTASITSVERLGARPFGAGSEVRIRQPRMPAMVWRVTALDAGASFWWEARNPGLLTAAGHSVRSSRPGRTTVTLTVEQRGPLAGLVNALAGSRVRRFMQMEAEGLKRRCEDG